MEEIKLSLSQAGPSGELSIVRVDGVVDTITASELEAIIEKLINQNRFRILIDLGGVEYISSAGWGIFISRIQEIREHSGDIKLANMIPNVYEIYELLEFENIIPAYSSLEQGKRAFNIAVSGSSGEDKVWKTDSRVMREPGASMQAAMMPGTENRSAEQIPAGARDSCISSARTNLEEVVLRFVIEDPFSSIAELRDQAAKAVPDLSVTWWKVFSLLRHKHLLSRRARFRLTRKHSRH